MHQQSAPRDSRSTDFDSLWPIGLKARANFTGRIVAGSNLRRAPRRYRGAVDGRVFMHRSSDGCRQRTAGGLLRSRKRLRSCPPQGPLSGRISRTACVKGLRCGPLRSADGEALGPASESLHGRKPRPGAVGYGDFAARPCRWDRARRATAARCSDLDARDPAFGCVRD